MDTERIGVEGACLGLETPNGRVFPVKDHVAQVPTGEAKRFLDSGAPNLSRTPKVRSGWSRRGELAWERIFGRKEERNAPAEGTG